MSRLVYSPHFDIRVCGAERLHPFDSRKYSRAFRLLQRSLGTALPPLVARPSRASSVAELRAVHTAGYLSRLDSAETLAAALEIPALARVPAALLRWLILRPMRWGCAGTLLAGRLALEHGLAINLSGGYHHARPDGGEGFCVYADTALLVHTLRSSAAIPAQARIAYIDLDAHQGNGVCHCFLHDQQVFLFDMFNRDIYPRHDQTARERVDCAVPLATGCSTATYLSLLESRLPGFLDSVSRTQPLALMIYNAGTDILSGDPLGQLDVSSEGILERDRLVAEQAANRRIPLVILQSGGYTQMSHRVIAQSAERLLRGAIR